MDVSKETSAIRKGGCVVRVMVESKIDKQKEQKERLEQLAWQRKVIIEEYVRGEER